MRAWHITIRDFDGHTVWAATRSAAKYQAARACAEAGYFRYKVGDVFKNGFEFVYRQPHLDKP